MPMYVDLTEAPLLPAADAAMRARFSAARASLSSNGQAGGAAMYIVTSQVCVVMLHFILHAFP